MKVVVQRVTNASVTVAEKCVSEIGIGLLVLVGIEDQDTNEDIQWLTKKIENMRIFNDANQVMNCSYQT